jgi:hypothetical protein
MIQDSKQAPCKYVQMLLYALQTQIDILWTDHQLKIYGFTIKKCSRARFLGVIIDEKLNWDAHIKFLKRKLNYAISTFYRIMDSIPK